MLKKNELTPWRVISSKQILEVEPWFSIQQENIELPNGQFVNDYYTIEHREHVVIFAVNSANKAICLWQYKHGPRQVCLALPAGYIEEGELPIDAAKRELLEETGCKADVWSYLGSYTVDGNRGCGKANIFRAECVDKVVEPAPNDLEEFKIEWIDLELLKSYLLSGEVKNMSDVVAISLGMMTCSRKTGQYIADVTSGVRQGDL